MSSSADRERMTGMTLPEAGGGRVRLTEYEDDATRINRLNAERKAELDALRAELGEAHKAHDRFYREWQAERDALIEALERIMDTSTGCVAGHYQIADAALDALSQTKGKGG